MIDRGTNVLTSTVRVYGALNDFLPAAHKQATLVCTVESSASVKALLEAIGVPHPEIDLLVVNGRAVDFAYRVRDDYSDREIVRISGAEDRTLFTRDVGVLKQRWVHEPTKWRPKRS